MPALDGLRALAVLGVMGFHAQAPGFAVGFFGVDVSFVLSGYLISTILLEQFDRDGRIAYRAFYLHRLLRLSQALLTMLAAYALLAPLVWPGRPHVLHAALSALYVTDYSLALWGPPRLLSHTWSLSVEEHFYLLWPPLLAWAARRWGAATLPRALFALTAAATVWRLACLLQGQGWNAIYYRFDTRLSGLLLGASLAALIRDPGGRQMLLRHQDVLRWLPLAALPVLLLRWGLPGVFAYGTTLVEIAAAAVVAGIACGSAWRPLAHPLLVGIGKLSYGLYLWHYPIMRWLRPEGWEVVMGIGVPLTFAMAWLSVQTVERWSSRLRARIDSRSGPAPGPNSRSGTAAPV